MGRIEAGRDACDSDLFNPENGSKAPEPSGVGTVREGNGTNRKVELMLDCLIGCRATELRRHDGCNDQNHLPVCEGKLKESSNRKRRRGLPLVEGAHTDEVSIGKDV